MYNCVIVVDAKPSAFDISDVLIRLAVKIIFQRAHLHLSRKFSKIRPSFVRFPLGKSFRVIPIGDSTSAH